MDEIRKLVYEDKASLDAFEVNVSESLNNRIYTEWLLGRTEIDPFDANHQASYLKAFNDAYYICTLAMLLPPSKKLLPDRLIKKVEKPSVVFPMVLFYLSRLTNLPIGLDIFLTQLKTAHKIRNDWQQNLEELKKIVDEYDDVIDPNIFVQRKLTKEILSKVNWCVATDNFNKKNIKSIVINYARKNDVWSMMVEAIKTAAQKYDYEYGFEDYTEEGFDENGPYIQTVKVPKSPYDINGEEYLEPLKRAGVFQFCDELKEKYDELSVKDYWGINPVETKVVPPNSPRREQNVESLLFRENLKPTEIAKALGDLKSTLVVEKKLGERNFFKIVHDALCQLKWLNDRQNTHFIKWAQNAKIMTSATTHFKGLSQYHNDDVLNIIIQKFSEKKPNGAYDDKDEYYGFTPQHERKKKYNNG